MSTRMPRGARAPVLIVLAMVAALAVPVGILFAAKGGDDFAGAYRHASAGPVMPGHGLVMPRPTT